MPAKKTTVFASIWQSGEPALFLSEDDVPLERKVWVGFTELPEVSTRAQYLVEVWLGVVAIRNVRVLRHGEVTDERIHGYFFQASKIASHVTVLKNALAACGVAQSETVALLECMAKCARVADDAVYDAVNAKQAA